MTKSNNYTFRQATADDTVACVDLIYSSAPELLEYVFTQNGVSSKEFVRATFEKGGGFLGHKAHTEWSVTVKSWA